MQRRRIPTAQEVARLIKSEPGERLRESVDTDVRPLPVQAQGLAQQLERLLEQGRSADALGLPASQLLQTILAFLQQCAKVSPHG